MPKLVQLNARVRPELRDEVLRWSLVEGVSVQLFVQEAIGDRVAALKARVRTMEQSIDYRDTHDEFGRRDV